MTKVAQSIFPYSGEIIAEYPYLSQLAVERKIQRAKKAFHDWKNTSIAYRADLQRNAAKILLENKEKYAALITGEMGKIIGEARAEVEKCAFGLHYYADNAEAILQDKTVATDTNNIIAHQPIGCVFAIMPWNFPFWQAFRYAAATLMAGNVSLLKHAPNVSGCSLAIEEVYRLAGYPEGVFQSLVMDLDLTDYVISQDIVQGVTLTGSERAGSAVAALAGKYIKKSVLELGGSDPVLVLDDADVEKAARIATASRMMNAGQSCIAAKRFLVTKKNSEQFAAAVEKNIAAIRQGDPFDAAMQMGPMARLDLATSLYAQYTTSLARGARKIIGGEHEGCNFQPTLLLDVTTDMPTMCEETFGPLAAIYTVDNEDKMIAVANQTSLGLGASIYTEDRERGLFLAKKINAGSVFINNMVKSDPRIPFGGIKKSGYGRELSAQGMLEFTNTKTISIY
jgi:succinate-semialdehyde dehydrogenase / glutarate-semialdehyde dehydrogenase